ncbi:hypothetical protein LXL04_030803 [Taraxacum kok-saghyz]
MEGQDRVLATAQQIVKSLNMNTQATEDMIMILSRFDNRLSNISDLMDGGADGTKTKNRFESAEKVILQHEGDPSSRNSLPWEESPEEASEYLAAVDLIIQLTEGLNVESEEDDEVMDRAENALQLAMFRLEDEFRHILVRNTVPLDADRLYGSVRSVSRSNNEIEDESESILADDHENVSYRHERGASLGGDFCVDLIRVEAIEELKDIADRMIRSGYEKECCQVYSNVRRDVLDECLSILGMERHSIEEIQRIEWKILDEKAKKWILAVKVVVRVLLFGEKRLCEQLLNFGEAVAIGERSSEKLFRILDMYEVLSDASQDLEALYESEELLSSETKGVLNGLSHSAIGTFMEFEKAVKNETSRPIHGGDIHPITRYVMNYMKLLVDYSNTLNSMLPDEVNTSSDLNNGECGSVIVTTSPIGTRLQLLITTLESNIEEKSTLYEDSSMRYVFLMNNILYVIQKVKDSDLRSLMGDQWIRKRRGKIRQWHTGYLRSSWSKALLCLKDEGIGNGGSGSSSSSASCKAILKERFKNFNLCFEDIYRVQTGWKVPDYQLREELRISISEKVLPAYRAFLGRFGCQLESGRHVGKYIKEKVHRGVRAVDLSAD